MAIVSVLTVAGPLVAVAEANVRIEDVEDSLARDPSFKVRVEAALILGRLRQPRSIPALVGALRDPNGGVRAAAADALGDLARPEPTPAVLTTGTLPRDALFAALHDPEPGVRRSARAALHRMGVEDDARPAMAGEAEIRHRHSETSFEVKGMGDPARHAGPAMQSHMRDFLIAQLRPYGEVEPREGHGTYAIDGVIKDLSLSTSGRDVEVTCAVQLTISKQPGGGVFMLTNGQATVQKPRRQFRPQLRPSMELEALETAVRAASEDLVTHLARR
ncbi:MAG TPA: HEAT repeat domain-containing protein [Polyangia bacterium]|nr:HEAT repeat domain-containing protein [Polyangia bacterium]